MPGGEMRGMSRSVSPIITDRLGACDACVTDPDRAGAILRVGYQIWHTFRRRRFFAHEWREERIHRSIHARKVGRTVGLKDAIQAYGVRKNRMVIWNHRPKSERLENVS